ncbi:hypothetical protein AK812_SmicGene31945 [Symbiodinium microadriaticum]|uniref:Uncharacterized protein n=1 Tax=Symbiodinium microadriaticum TaxID=2951 RepID=A0A1Q9CVE9_SYMMI|nr:hypothetical protein AK812_SmicGene31945 [Symbiodinium microadriaticum]
MRPVALAGVLWWDRAGSLEDCSPAWAGLPAFCLQQLAGVGGGAQAGDVSSARFQRCWVAFSECRESGLDDRQSIRQTCQVCCRAGALRRLDPQATQMGRQRRERFHMRRFCFGGAPQALLEGMPYSLVMGACIRLDFQQGNRAQGMVCTRGRAQQQQQPRTLQVWEFGQLAEQPLFFLEAPGCPSLDEILVAYGRAKHYDTALFGAQVASPHFVSELGYAGRWGPILGSNRPCYNYNRCIPCAMEDHLDALAIADRQGNVYISDTDVAGNPGSSVAAHTCQRPFARQQSGWEYARGAQAVRQPAKKENADEIVKSSAVGRTLDTHPDGIVARPRSERNLQGGPLAELLGGMGKPCATRWVGVRGCSDRGFWQGEPIILQRQAEGTIAPADA